MKYEEKITLKNGKEALIRNGDRDDGAEVFDVFCLTHEETDYLLSYPDETSFDAIAESKFLAEKTESPNEVELIAVVDGKIAGIAGIEAVGKQYKLKHRAEFGISVLKKYWGLGVGRALTEACIRCAKDAGYDQLELDVVSENDRAVDMYKDLGFVEFGRNPAGFNSRMSGHQELILMLLKL